MSVKSFHDEIRRKGLVADMYNDALAMISFTIRLRCTMRSRLYSF